MNITKSLAIKLDIAVALTYTLISLYVGSGLLFGTCIFLHIVVAFLLSPSFKNIATKNTLE